MAAPTDALVPAEAPAIRPSALVQTQTQTSHLAYTWDHVPPGS
jgi:hypothetical protein